MKCADRDPDCPTSSRGFSSANRHQLIVPRTRLNTHDRRAFSIAGPTVWNSLPDKLSDPACGSDSFKQFLKTIPFRLYWYGQRIGCFKWYALYKSTFHLLTYLLTYLHRWRVAENIEGLVRFGAMIKAPQVPRGLGLRRGVGGVISFPVEAPRR